MLNVVKHLTYIEFIVCHAERSRSISYIERKEEETNLFYYIN